MNTILILHSTVDGQTKKICQYISDDLQKTAPNLYVLQKSVDACTLADINHSDIIVLGASIRYGKHRNSVYQFVEKYKDQLDAKTSAFFSVNLVARKDAKNTDTTNPYVIKFLEQTQWKPNIADVFSGKLDYALYGFFDKLMIKFIMWMTKGPTHSDKPIEFTNWLRVRSFTKKILTHTNSFETNALSSDIPNNNIPKNDTTSNDISNNDTPSNLTINNDKASNLQDAKEPIATENFQQTDNQDYFQKQINAQSNSMENVLIVCSHCDTVNRIPTDRISDQPICGQCKQEIFSNKPINLNNNVHKYVQKNQVLTIVDFWASWCQPCIQMAPQFASASDQLPNVVFAKLQTDKFEQASMPYNIRSLPTMVAFKNGVEIARQSGAMPAGQIVQWVKSLQG